MIKPFIIPTSKPERLVGTWGENSPIPILWVHDPTDGKFIGNLRALLFAGKNVLGQLNPGETIMSCTTCALDWLAKPIGLQLARQAISLDCLRNNEFLAEPLASMIFQNAVAGGMLKMDDQIEADYYRVLRYGLVKEGASSTHAPRVHVVRITNPDDWIKPFHALDIQEPDNYLG